MFDLLIRNGTVITVDADRRVIAGGYVAVKDGAIAAVGPASEAEGASAARVIDAGEYAVLPGFVDVHGHAGHALTKTLTEHTGKWEEVALDIYLRRSTTGFWFEEARLSALEKVKFGTTTAVSMIGSSPRVDNLDIIDAHFEGAQQVGIRIISGIGSPNPPWPKTAYKWTGDTYVERIVRPEVAYENTAKVVARWNNTNRGKTYSFVMPSRIGMAPPNSPAFAIEQMREMRRIADEYGTRLHSHSYRGDIKFTYENSRRCLGPDVLLAHCTGITDEEVALLAETGTHVTSGPSTHAYITARCPVIELLKAGANVALCTDGNAPDRTFDLWKEMRTSQIQHRGYFHDAGLLPAGKVLEMVTIDAAKAVGLDHLVGSLEPGKRADIVLVDVRQPHLAPFMMPVQRLVYAASGQDVSTVIVDGQVIMEQRKVLTVDERQVMEAAARELELALERGNHFDKTLPPSTLWRAWRY